MFIARQRDTDPSKPPQFSFDKKDRRVTVYYFYLWDADFGPAFIKVCTYCPWPIKVWVNGHEWAKRQAAQAGIGFTELSNGFAACEDPETLQGICDRLGPGTSTCSSSAGWPGCRCRSPRPTATPATGGSCRWRRSRCPAPWCSRQPRYARGFFEALVTDNLDLGRPDTIEIIFDRQIRGGKRATGGEFKTKSSPAAPRSPSTPSTSTPASSNI